MANPCGFLSVPVNVLGCPSPDEVKGGIPPLKSPARAKQTTGKQIGGLLNAQDLA
jgi:hypothetical protein